MSADTASKLVLRAEAALARAELREPDWDALSARIESALGAASSTDDSLLLPPLPESVEDGREEIAARETDERESEGPRSQRGDASLAELARAAVARRSSKDALDLVKASLAIASQSRALPETPRRVEPSATAAVSAELTREREQSTLPPARGQQSSLDTRGPWIGVAIATIGLAAGFGLYLASRAPAASIAASPAPVTAPAVATTAGPLATDKAAAPSATALAVPHGETAEMLPVEKEALADPMPSAAPAAEHAPAALKAAAAASPPRGTTAANATRARPEKLVLEEDAAAAAKSSPSKATSSAMRPAELNAANGGMSDRPSTGAAQAAVGAVLGAARSCIAGQPQASSATIVFGSSGEVTGVNVSGPADGTPAAACIKAALGKARVQPFAAPNFSLGVTVRPL
ncbi:MAG TPA: hypothetical protein VLJ38_14885 [Polyangiaceae bacterium]|nr:hypothetical protein [Polyangiaceae bacterium]